MPRIPCSLYPAPQTPPNVLLRVPPEPWTLLDQLIIGSSSLFLVGSVAWVPALYAYIYKRWKRVQNKRKKALYGALILALTGLFIAGPQRTPKFGDKINFRDWKIWQIWCRFLAVEVWRDTKKNIQTPTESSSASVAASELKVTQQYGGYKSQPNITAMVPHGIFPFAIGVAGVPGMLREAFGNLRIMTATATNLFPLVRDVIRLVNNVDASRPAVNRALSDGDRLALIPGGIPEIFEGYPKPLTHPDDECSIVPRGFLKMALRHQVPVVPVYCFGATKLFHRLQLPDIVERLSLALRISICIFFGKYGLPIPFRQRLFYVMGDPIVPPLLSSVPDPSRNTQQQENDLVNTMYKQFCDELVRLFENHKDSYGWSHKSLQLISR